MQLRRAIHRHKNRLPVRRRHNAEGRIAVVERDRRVRAAVRIEHPDFIRAMAGHPVAPVGVAGDAAWIHTDGMLSHLCARHGVDHRHGVGIGIHRPHAPCAAVIAHGQGGTLRRSRPCWRSHDEQFHRAVHDLAVGIPDLHQHARTPLVRVAVGGEGVAAPGGPHTVEVEAILQRRFAARRRRDRHRLPRCGLIHIRRQAGQHGKRGRVQTAAGGEAKRIGLDVVPRCITKPHLARGIAEKIDLISRVRIQPDIRREAQHPREIVNQKSIHRRAQHVARSNGAHREIDPVAGTTRPRVLMQQEAQRCMPRVVGSVGLRNVIAHKRRRRVRSLLMHPNTEPLIGAGDRIPAGEP